MAMTGPWTLWLVPLLLLGSRLLAHAADFGLTFVRSPEPLIAPVGDNVVFECALNIPADEVRWRRDSAPLRIGDSSTLGFDEFEPDNFTAPLLNHRASQTRLSVVIEGPEQTGDYQCICLYGASALASVPARLTLAELAAFPEMLSTKYHVIMGNTIAVSFPVPDGSPPPTFQFFKNGEQIQNPITSSPSTLVMMNVTISDSGQFRVTATNYITGQTSHSTHSITLVVLPSQGSPIAPVFLGPDTRNYTVQSGSNVTLECTASGRPTPSITWSRVDRLPISGRFSMIVPGGLKLIHVSRTEHAPNNIVEYRCVADNGQSSISKNIKLTIQEPPRLIKEPAMLIVKEGEQLNLECAFTGIPVPEISWLLNGVRVNHDYNIITHDGNITIEHVEKSHAGIIQCFGTNNLGSVYGASLLQVIPKQVNASDPNFDLTGTRNIFTTAVSPIGNGKRNHSNKRKNRHKDKKHKGNVMIPPTRPNVTRLSDSSVMVRWSVPLNQGLPIQFFKVQYLEMRAENGGGGSRRSGRWMTNNDDIPPHVRSYAIDGLETDHIYRFRIAAVYSNNDNKLGPTSLKFHLHKGTNFNRIPSVPPLLTKAEALSPTSIQIHWKHSLGHVEGFYVYYRPTTSAGEFIKATVDGDKTRHYIITHLIPETSYEIKLQSFTVAGASNFSHFITQKTFKSIPEVSKIDATNSTITTGPTENNFFIEIGASIGGVCLIVVLFLTLYLCRRKHKNSQTTEDPNEHQDKFNDSVIHATDPVNAFGKNIMNGCITQNGYIQNNKMNITNNPLAETEGDKIQSGMEMSFLQSQNNNCSSSSEASSSSGSTETPSTNWNETKPPQTGENYV